MCINHTRTRFLILNLEFRLYFYRQLKPLEVHLFATSLRNSMSKPAESGKPARGPRTYRILTLGDGAVGKTSLLRFYRGDKTPVVSTIGIDMVLADAVVRGRSMKLQIWVRLPV